MKINGKNRKNEKKIKNSNTKLIKINKNIIL